MARTRHYTSPLAFPNPQRLRLFYQGRGDAGAFDAVIQAMLPDSRQRKWPHRKMNRWGETPTLERAGGRYLAGTRAIARCLGQFMPGRKVMGEAALAQGRGAMWGRRIWIPPDRITTMFHVLHQGLGPKRELTPNPAWDEHCRTEALVHAGLVDRQLADGRERLHGGSESTFADIMRCTAIAVPKLWVNAPLLDACFEQLDRCWRRRQDRASFCAADADGDLAELDNLRG